VAPRRYVRDVQSVAGGSQFGPWRVHIK
jgi:hypothetical protein